MRAGNRKGGRFGRINPEQEYEKDIWQRLSGGVIAVFIVGILILVASWFMPEVDRLRAESSDLDELVALRDRLQSTRDAKAEEFRLLRFDTAYFETRAREKLGLQRAGETIFRIEPPVRGNDD